MALDKLQREAKRKSFLHTGNKRALHNLARETKAAAMASSTMDSMGHCFARFNQLF
jgi:hypothetical protein